jgi:hypothetical protein
LTRSPPSRPKPRPHPIIRGAPFIRAAAPAPAPTPAPTFVRGLTSALVRRCAKGESSYVPQRLSIVREGQDGVLARFKIQGREGSTYTMNVRAPVQPITSLQDMQLSCTCGESSVLIPCKHLRMCLSTLLDPPTTVS